MPGDRRKISQNAGRRARRRQGFRESEPRPRIPAARRRLRRESRENGSGDRFRRKRRRRAESAETNLLVRPAGVHARSAFFKVNRAFAAGLKMIFSTLSLSLAMRNEALDSDRLARFGAGAALEILNKSPNGYQVLVSLADLWRAYEPKGKQEDVKTDVWIFEIVDRDSLTPPHMKVMSYLRIGTNLWEIEKRRSYEDNLGMWRLRAQSLRIG